MKDIKYIIKRIIIGVGITLAIMFIRQNVYAYEWETSSDTQIPTTDYSVAVSKRTSHRFSMNPSYSLSTDDSFDYFNQTANAPTSGAYYSNIIPVYYNNLGLIFSNITLEPNTYYKVIIPIRYNSQVFTSLTNNVNQDKILDSSNYTTNNSNWSVYSATLGFNIENDLDTNSNYPLYMYFNIIFSGTTSVSDLEIYINGNNTISHTITSYNTISDSNYLFKTNMTCSSPSSGNCTYYTNRIYNPFLYTTSTSADNWFVDGNDVISSGTTSIKDEIESIINGQFSEDLSFPSVNTGEFAYGENDYSLQDLLIMPLQFLKGFINESSECSGIQLPLPGFNAHFTLTCPSVFATSILGASLVYIIKQILGFCLCFAILYDCYNTVIRLLSPLDLMYIDSWI